jgi:hypothetical protein
MRRKGWVNRWEKGQHIEEGWWQPTVDKRGKESGHKDESKAKSHQECPQKVSRKEMSYPLQI